MRSAEISQPHWSEACEAAMSHCANPSRLSRWLMEEAKNKCTVVRDAHTALALAPR